MNVCSVKTLKVSDCYPTTIKILPCKAQPLGV